MGFNFRKSIKVAPGVRVNIGKSGASVSLGTKGIRHTIHTSGRSRTTIGLPGTGLSYTQNHSRRSYKTNSYKRNLELNRMLKEKEKLEILEKNRLEVELFNNRIEMIKSIHKEVDDFVDWNKVYNIPSPFNKGEKGTNTIKAEQKRFEYKPTILEKLTKKNIVIENELDSKIIEANKLDMEEYNSWERVNNLARRMINRDISAYLDVIEEFRPVDDLLEFGSEFEFFLGESNYMGIEFYVDPDKLIPKEIKTLTKTGKVSTKKMSKTMFYDIEQDYVCSCTLRVARDMFALLPLDFVVINAISSKLDTSTGNIKKVIVLSIKIDRDVLDSLNLDKIDPSDSMLNFVHNMDFKKTRGLVGVNMIDLSQF